MQPQAQGETVGKAPNPKHQRSLELQASIRLKFIPAHFGSWDLGFLWSLELGRLELFWLELGDWN